LFEPNNDCLAECLIGKRVFVLIDPTVGDFYGEKIRGYLRHYRIPVAYLKLKRQSRNENNKSLSVLQDLALQMHRWQPRVGDLLLLIGGGVIMDLGGFLASIYRRGLKYIAIPSSLLAIVDASVSPKTAINVAGIKNLFGTQHPPSEVLYDPTLLRTLRHGDFCNGVAEVLKVALVGDESLFDHLSRTPVQVLKEEFCGQRASSILENSIQLFLNLKWTGPFYGNKPASIRAFGHGFSRELETASHFALSHGSAVSVEMAVATHLSVQRGVLSSSESARIMACFRHLGLPTSYEGCNANMIWKQVFAEKFERHIPFYYPIVERIGKGTFLNRFSRDDLANAIKAVRAGSFSHN